MYCNILAGAWDGSHAGISQNPDPACTASRITTLGAALQHAITTKNKGINPGDFRLPDFS